MHPMPEDITTCRITPGPVSRLEVEGGTASAVIELANGPDEPPEPKMVDLPTWPGYVAHTRWPGDGAIYMFEADAYLPDEPVDLRCSGCTAASTIAIDSLERRIVFIIGHQRGCRAIEDMLAMGAS